MIQNYRRFAEHYTVLALLLSLGLLALIWWRSNQAAQQIVIWSVSAAYVIWGIVHHYLRRDITYTIVLEYFLFSLIGGFVIQAVVLFR